MPFYSTTDGTGLAEAQLEAVRIFDGLIAAGSRLYTATADGRIICWQADEK